MKPSFQLIVIRFHVEHLIRNLDLKDFTSRTKRLPREFTNLVYVTVTN